MTETTNLWANLDYAIEIAIGDSRHTKSIMQVGTDIPLPDVQQHLQKGIYGLVCILAKYHRGEPVLDVWAADGSWRINIGPGI